MCRRFHHFTNMYLPSHLIYLRISIILVTSLDQDQCYLLLLRLLLVFHLMEYHLKQPINNNLNLNISKLDSALFKWKALNLDLITLITKIITIHQLQDLETKMDIRGLINILKRKIIIQNSKKKLLILKDNSNLNFFRMYRKMCVNQLVITQLRIHNSPYSTTILRLLLRISLNKSPLHLSLLI